MAKALLSKRTVDGTQPGEKDMFVWDDGKGAVKGFGLKVTPTGRKVYLFQYRVNGRGTPRRYTIGTHGAYTPDQARSRAEELAKMVASGIDPVEAEKAAETAKQKAEADRQRAERLATEMRVDALSDRFLKEHIQIQSPASYEFCDGILRLHVNPVIGAISLPSLSRADVNSVMAKLPAKRAALRRNTFAVMRWLCAWATDALDLPANPMLGMKPPPTVKARDRVLDDDELALAWRAAGKMAQPFRALYRLLIATGQRREEVAGLDWSELDRSAATWTLPAARSKNDEANIIPLSALAMTELDNLAEGDKWPRRGLALTTTGTTAVSGFSRAKTRLDGLMMEEARKDAEKTGEDPAAVEIDAWRVHDLRRTLATGLQRLGVRFEVTEAILNHVSGARGGVAGVYQRYGWTDEKRTALDAWARHIEGILAGATLDNVVPITGSAA